MSVLGKLDEATAEASDMLSLIEQMHPEMADQLAVVRADMAASLLDTFRPLLDLADGKITTEQYHEVMAQRAEAERARRQEYWENAQGESDSYEVQCEECYETSIWDVEEQGGEFPPTYFVCEDLDGIDCQADDEEGGGE